MTADLIEIIHSVSPPYHGSITGTKLQGTGGNFPSLSSGFFRIPPGTYDHRFSVGSGTQDYGDGITQITSIVKYHA
jgi:hypothetical protein